METKIDLSKIRTLRKQACLTQADVARELGYKSCVGYHYIESGRCKLRADQLVVLARILGVSVEDLITKTESGEIHGQA